MRVMVFVKASEDSEKGMAPTPEMLEAFAAMDRFTEELVEAGVFVAAAGLKPSAEGKRIVFDGPSRTVIDGPFAEARELVAGFSIWEVKDMDEAVAWAKRCPNSMPGAQRDRDPAVLRGGGPGRVRDAGGARDAARRRAREVGGGLGNAIRRGRRSTGSRPRRSDRWPPGGAAAGARRNRACPDRARPGAGRSDTRRSGRAR